MGTGIVQINYTQIIIYEEQENSQRLSNERIKLNHKKLQCRMETSNPFNMEHMEKQQ